MVYDIEHVFSMLTGSKSLLKVLFQKSTVPSRTDEVLQDLIEISGNLATVKGDDVAMLDNLILERRVLCSMSALGALFDNIDVCRMLVKRRTALKVTSSRPC